jgi:hypothetical protein
MSVHTAGPWTRDGFGVWSHAGGENRRVACTEFDRGDGPYKVRTEAEAVANAQLCASAPDLLAALTVCLEYIDSITDTGNLAVLAYPFSRGLPESTVYPQVMARAAIANARGDA